MKECFLHITGLLLAAGLTFTACTADPLEPQGQDNEPETEVPTVPDQQPDPSPDPKPEPQPESPDQGSSYVWEEGSLPEILVEVSLGQWNQLLQHFDKDEKTGEYIHCKVTFDKNGEKTVLEDTGLRLRGNTSRRRPEKGNSLHQGDQSQWQHCHYYLNFKKFNKDKETNSIQGVKKLYLKWFKDDPSYVREVFCYDLFHRAGIWTASQSGWCRLSIHVEGDSKPAYLGIYEMLEPIDNRYLERRSGGTDPSKAFTAATGNLWKCTWGADLRTSGGNTVDESKIGPDDSTRDYPYELKEDARNYEAAKIQLMDFMQKLNGKGDENFKTWIQQVCDVRLLLRTYAINVAVGMWDDHWNNQNNYYLYFDSLDRYDYHVYFIPYDYDNTLGSSQGMDSGRQDPYHWGSRGKLMERMMGIPEFRKIYQEELERLIAQGNGYMYWEEAAARIRQSQDRLRDHVANDTGEDMAIEDRTASWSNHQEYRLLSSANNFFRIKAESILRSSRHN